MGPHKRYVLRVLIEETTDLGSQHSGLKSKHSAKLLLLQPEIFIVQRQEAHP